MVVLIESVAPSDSTATTAAPQQQLEVTPERHLPRLVVRESVTSAELLPRLKSGKRPLAAARRLMALTSHLRVFRALKSELGKAWPATHLALCAELQPLWVPAGELIFTASQLLKQPILILQGQAGAAAQKGYRRECPRRYADPP